MKTLALAFLFQFLVVVPASSCSPAKYCAVLRAGAGSGSSITSHQSWAAKTRFGNRAL